MKKIFMFLAVAGIMAFTAQNAVAQDSTKAAPATTEQQAAPASGSDMSSQALMSGSSDQPIYQQIKIKFIEGGPGFMATIILCLIFGLAITVERIIYLNLASVDTDKLVKKVDEALNNGGIDAAKEICRNTRGPVASIFYQGLSRMDQGLDVVEKSITSFGSVQMGQLESGLTWIALFIALAPMLGFLGTVVGMVQAFDAIESAGDISPTVVAGGIKVALITTIGGLIVAIILQLFYNYIVSRIDSIVNGMENSSINFIDVLTHFSNKK